MDKKRILVAPLDWGLGHATRCIPLINELIERNYIPVLASSGASLKLLCKEFPNLENHTLPSYDIKYSRNKKFFRLKLLLQTFHILRTIKAEKKATAQLVRERNISGIISDNRWGVRSPLVPSVFITHQINVLSGSFSYFSSKIHQYFIQKFDECWVPDVSGTTNLSGKMGHQAGLNFPVKYLGVLSRMKKENLPEIFDVSIILSGPEPQRSILENLMIRELKGSALNILLVKGVVEKEQKKIQEKNITTYNYLTSGELQFFLNSSKKIISRSGYSGVMDLIKIEKPALLIPTPGQYEQEYLAKSLKQKGIFESCSQENFSIKKLQESKISCLSFLFLPFSQFREAFTFFEGE